MKYGDIVKEKLKKIIPRKIYKIFCNCYDEILYLINKFRYIFNKKIFKKINILEDEKTIELIVNEKKSLARFGDGEFKWIFGVKQNSFQDNDENLSKRLLEVLQSNEPNLLLGVPYALKNVSIYNHKAKLYWVNFLGKYGLNVFELLDKEKEYANSTITRPYIDFRNKKNCKKRFDLLKKIWYKRRILLVEGSQTKMGENNDLFDNVLEIKKIICPSTNAFSKYDEIISEVKCYEKNYLVILCLGPTATVLAYDLCRLGYQAIDTGHTDIEYEWFLCGAHKKQKVIGKHVNEASK